MFDKVLSTSDEVVKDILLASEVACLVPVFAVFDAATEVGGCRDATLVEPNACLGSDKKWFLADVEATVTVKQHGVGAVELRAFAANDVEGNAGAVFGHGKVTHDFGVIELDGRSLVQGGAHGLTAGGVKAVPGGRIEVSGGVEERVASANRDDLADG